MCIRKILVLIFLTGFSVSFAQFVKASPWLSKTEAKFSYPIYVGILGGYGSTLWDGLVPPKSKQNQAIMISAPIEAQEGGGIWGFFAGFELIPNFAIEANYLHYPNAKICFDEDSLFTFTHDSRSTFITKTEKFGLLAKFMVFIPATAIRAYSSIGAAEIHRVDELINRWRLGPAFALGLNYNVTQHIMAEMGADYASGYGVPELSPANNYIPFLWAGFLRFAYRF